MGGKAAALHRLLAAGLPVPEALVVTCDAFAAHFPDPTAGQAPEPPVVDRRLTDALEAALTGDLGAGCPLAVRSSAVGEDGRAASFAGQHATYYWVTADTLADAVRHCWLSLWSPAALAYRQAHGNGAPPAMAVIVQRQLDADRSGVCFTVDPTHRTADRMCVEAIWGLGAALVDGRTSPDRWMLDGSGRILSRRIGRKRHRVPAGPREPGDGRLESVPLTRQNACVLADEQVGQVAALARACRDHGAGPQDVEWAFEGERLWLLQSRPVTGLAPDAAAPPGRWVLFKPLAENFTEPLTPMSEDLFGRTLPPLGRFIEGRFYLDLNALARLNPFRLTAAELVDAALLRGQPATWRPTWWKLPALATGFALLYLLDGIAWHRSALLRRDALAAYANRCAAVAADPDVTPPDALQRLVLGRYPLEPLGRRAYYVNISSGRYFLLLGVLHRLLARWAPDYDRQAVNRLCRGDGETASRQLVDGLAELAAEARRDPALAERLQRAGPTALAGVVEALPPEHGFASTLADLLGRFGHRAIGEMELATPRWREDPLPLLSMLQAHLETAPRETGTAARGEELATRDRLHQAAGLSGRRWRRWAVDRLLDRIRHYASLREDSRHFHSMAMDVTRQKLLAVEQTLLAAGQAQLPGDVFFLRWREVVALQNGALSAARAAARVRRRRRRHSRLARRPPPPTFGVDPVEAQGTDRTGDGARVLHGACASPGSAEGRVRIVFDPATCAALEPGDVLVAPYTDPGWTPLFPAAAAVVVEVGSFLSHAGTVAREYDIPCLVDVADCTGRLREGQRVRVLADQGRLEILEP